MAAKCQERTQLPQTERPVALGERIAAIAEASAAGHRVSAARAYLRAADYFAVAVNSIDGLDGDTAKLLPAFRAHRTAWEGFVANTHWPIERVDIPYEGSCTIPPWSCSGCSSCARPR